MLELSGNEPPLFFTSLALLGIKKILYIIYIFLKRLYPAKKLRSTGYTRRYVSLCLPSIARGTTRFHKVSCIGKKLVFILGVRIVMSSVHDSGPKSIYICIPTNRYYTRTLTYLFLSYRLQREREFEYIYAPAFLITYKSQLLKNHQRPLIIHPSGPGAPYTYIHSSIHTTP